MFKKVTRILGVIALTGWMGAANATLIFDFSWNSVNGTVTGEILGLVDNTAGQAASGLMITSVTGMSGGSPDWDIFDSQHWFIQFNDFDVSGGQVVFFDFRAILQSTGGLIDMTSPNFLQTYSPSDTGPKYDNLSFVNPFVKRVTVPEPSSVILMLLGLAGLSFARYRKQY
jgi:hypothetical protein